MSRQHYLLLLIILLLGWAARVWQLPVRQAGFFVNEASARAVLAFATERLHVL